MENEELFLSIQSVLEKLSEADKKSFKSQEAIIKTVLALMDDYMEYVSNSTGQSTREIETRLMNRIRNVDIRKSKMYVVRD